MDLTYLGLLIGVLASYIAYSLWVRLDARYLLGAAVLVFLSAAILQWLGDPAAANDLAVDTFFVFLAGLLLVVLDRWTSDRRERRALALPDRSPEPAGQPADPR